MNQTALPEIDGFTFTKCLGRGGMATVWEARQHDPDRLVAVKILDHDISSSPKDVDAFYAEAKAAALLDHPNIVTVFEVGYQSGLYYYVMELAAGYDIGKWLARKGRLGEEDVLTVAESVGVALEFAFRTLGLVHCDVKPSNIMVDGDGTVMLTDMGIARFLRNSAQSDYIEGTPQYMSPEQTLGEVAMDERADIYSLGATMYHLLSGRPLFGGLPDEEAMERQRSATVEDVRQLNPEVSAPCAVMLSRFMAKDRDDRPAGWKEAVAMIRETLALRGAASGGAKRIPSRALRTFSRPSTMPLAGARHVAGARHGCGKGRVAPKTLHAAPAAAHAAAPPAVPARRVHGGDGAFWLWTAFAALAAFALAFAAVRFW